MNFPANKPQLITEENAAEQLNAGSNDTSALTPFRPLTTDKQDIVFWDIHNPRSLVNLLTEALKERAIVASPVDLSMPESELEKKFKPTWILRQLRIAFWDEYFSVVDRMKPSATPIPSNTTKFPTKMRMENIYGSICSREHFNEISKDKRLFGYVLNPKKDHSYTMKSMLDLALVRWQQILDLDPVKKNGEMDKDIVAAQAKITLLLDNRLRGAVPMRVEVNQTNRNLNVNVDAKTLNPNYEAPMSAVEMNEQLRDINSKIRIMQGLKEDPIEIEARNQNTIDVTTND